MVLVGKLVLAGKPVLVVGKDVVVVYRSRQQQLPFR